MEYGNMLESLRYYLIQDPFIEYIFLQGNVRNKDFQFLTYITKPA